MKKRILSMILVIVMVAGMLPVTAFAAEDTTAAEITGVSITVDGETYTEGNVTITPTSTIVFTATGTNFANVSADNVVLYAPGRIAALDDGWWSIDAEANTATMDLSEYISWLVSCDNFEVRYRNDDQENWQGTGIYLTYDDGIAEEDRAQITGVSITVDGEIYTEGEVTITPTSTVVYTVTGTNFANLSDDNYVLCAYDMRSVLNNGDWTIDTETNTATQDFSENISRFESSDDYQVYFSNDGGINLLGTGIYVTYEEPAPDSVGKIVVDMKDDYGDGWNGAAIAIYKNGSLEINATVDGASNTVSLDYDSTAIYEFRWVEGSYDEECSYTIYVDGREEQSVINTKVFADGEHLLTLGDPNITSADITGMRITVDGETYTEGDVTITPTSTVVLTVTGTFFINVSGENSVRYTARHSSDLDDSSRWTVDTEANTATWDCSADISLFESCNNFEVQYSNNGGAKWTDTGIYLTYVRPVPDSTGKIVVDMADAYGDGWNGAAIEIYKNGSLETTAAVDERFNTVSVDYDTAATYEFKWVKGSHDNECSFTIYVDGEEKLKIGVDGASGYANGETIQTLGDTTEPDTTPAEITGVSITIDGVTYDSTNTSAENPAVFTPETQSMTVTVHGTGLNNGSGDCWASYTPTLSCNTIDANMWTISGDGSFATNDAIWLRDILTVTSSVWEIVYGNTMSERLSSGVYLKFTTAVADKIVVDAASSAESWNGAAIEVYKNGSLETTVTVTEYANSVAMDDDITANYEFKWVKGEGAEGEFAIHLDGETVLSVPDISTLENGEIVLTIEADEAASGPVITQQPTDSSAKLGERYCVEVVAEGEGLTYKWYFRNKGASRWNVSSVTDSTYDDVMTTARAGRDVYCVITDAFGNSATTDTATLIGLPEVELQLLTQPNDASAKLGEEFCVTVVAEGDGLTYRWYYRKAGTERWLNSNVRDNTYDDVMTAARHNREVKCVITDAWGNSVTTDIAAISAIPTTTLEIIKQPEDQTVPLGDPFCVTVEAVGDGLKYQWYFQNASAEKFSVSGQKDNTYDDVMTRARHNRSLYCVITDAWGNSVTTDPVVVIMATQKHELAITAQPENTSVKMGEEFCVSVEAQGDEVKYQWYWRNVGAETWNTSTERDQTYDAVMTRARHNREVYCVITDMWGNRVETGIATITATPDQDLALVTQPTDASAKLGENYCVTVEATGDGLRYQWYFKNKGSGIWHKSGVTDNTYDDVMTASRAGREVYCVITDLWGNTVTTETVTLLCADDAQSVVKN